MENKTALNSCLRDFDGLEVRVINILVKANILTLDDLISKTESEILLIPRMGQHYLLLLKNWLNEKGLNLKDEFPSFSVDLSDTDLYISTTKKLRSNGINTLENLLSKTEQDILKIDGIYPRHYWIIKKWLLKHHLSLSSN